MDSKNYINPGQLFLQKHGRVSSLDDILLYAEFLREEAHVNGQLPVDLQAIIQHFGIKSKEAPLPVQGVLVDPGMGLILINSDDIKSRQKFSLAHELVELLFVELPQDKHWAGDWYLQRPGGFKETTKEFYCNWAGANLLMPPTYVQELIQKVGVSFDCATLLAQDCDVSLSAALIQLVRNSKRRYSVALWRMKNKPADLKNIVKEGQLSLFPGQNVVPSKKLRVEWSYGRKNSSYIPKNKSTETNSLIYSAWETGKFTSGRERMTFDNRTMRWFYSENMPYPSNEERFVLSLLELQSA